MDNAWMDAPRVEDGIVSTDEHLIPAGEEVTIYGQHDAGRPFRGEKMMVWEEIAGATSIGRIFAGERAHIIHEKTDRVKAAFFAPGTLGNGIKIRFSSTDKFGLLVKNTSERSIKVSAAIFGSFIE